MITTAPILVVDRHRMQTDGEGVTTLVVFSACPLHCRYCINDYCHDRKGKEYTPEQLYQELLIDQLYFLATGGGVTFGGGEPGLRADFIAKIRELCGSGWKINLESSLHISDEQLELLIPVVDHYFVDVKDLNPEIYERYTDCKVDLLMKHLKRLAELGLQERVTLRLPLIPDYNTDADRDASEAILKEMGFVHFDRFPYKLPSKGSDE